MDSQEEILVDGNSAPTVRNQNITERYRRLIPYMTFYLPGTNVLKLPINQAYNFMPPDPATMFHMQHQQIPPSHTFQMPQKIRQLITVPVPNTPHIVHPQNNQVQSMQLKPVVYLTSKFQIPTNIQRPPTQVLLNNPQHLPDSMPHYESPSVQEGKGYSTPLPPSGSHYSNIQFPSHLSQQLQSGVITQNYYQAQKATLSKLPSPQSSIQSSPTTKVNFTPFLPSNKLPGNFVPIQPNIHYNDENNLVYHNIKNNGGSFSVSNNQNHHNNNNNKRPSTGKPVFVTSTPRPILTAEDFNKYYGTTKLMQQTPANIYYSTPATNLLAQDIPITSYGENYNSDKNNLIYKDAVTSRPQSIKYNIREQQKPFYKLPYTTNTNGHSFVDFNTKGKDYIKVTPILVTTVSPGSVSNLSHKYSPKYIPLTESDIELPIAEKPFYSTTTTAPMYHPKFIQKLQSLTPTYPPVSTYRPTIKTYYNPPPHIIKYVTPPQPKLEQMKNKTTTTTRRPYVTVKITPSENTAGDYDGDSLATLLKKLQETNHLPETLTPDNIDNSIRTLVKILNNLKKSKDRYKVTPKPTTNDDYDYKYYDDDLDTSKVPNGVPGPNSGRPGVDYPNYSEIPETSFTCKEQRYKGFFGDPDTKCQVWHYCDLNGGKASFLCPNGTIFSQVALTCDWWFNVKCSNTAQQYVLNERLYKYILPFTPKFPEDYSGPLVDKYLAQKFEEMEEKLRRQKEKGLHMQHENEDTENQVDESSSTNSSSEEDDTSSNRIPVTEADVEEIIGHTIYVTTEASKESVGNNNNQNFVSATAMPLRHVPSPHPKTIVESERLHVIEIKTDGISGHLVRSTEGGDFGE